jgi:hypothetical protein
MATSNIEFPEPLERFYYFKKNQVLTACQLNQLAGHFDYENRKTRTKGLGIGILCGLNLSLESGSSGVRLSKGAAITTAGDLLQLDKDMIYGHIRLLQDVNTTSNGDSKLRVIKLGNETSTVPIWLLSENSGTGTKPLAEFATENSLNDFVLTLLLDSYLKQPETCTDTNCDNMGVTQVNDLLVALIPKQSLTKPVFNLNRFIEFQSFDVRKVDLSEEKISSAQNLFDRYENAVQPTLSSAISALKNLLVLFPEIVIEAKIGDPEKLNWETRLTDIATTKYKNTGEIQYVHALFKDLSDAIEEFRSGLMQDFPCECYTSPDMFPKYIMVGELVQVSEKRFPEYRNYFNQPPYFGGENWQQSRPAFLLKRIHYMIQSFDPLNNKLEIDVSRIRISPSLSPEASLSERAIPFYYAISKEYPLQQFWSYEKYLKGMTARTQGYWLQNEKGITKAEKPFDYDISKFNFFRVEGLHGLPVKEAEIKVEGLIIKHNLGFRIESIQIEDEVEKITPRKPIVFPELDTLFNHYREDLKVNLNLVKNYNKSLHTEYEKPGTKDLQSIKDPDDTEAYTNIKTAVLDDSSMFTTKADAISARMKKPLHTFALEFTEFRKDYDDAATLGHTIETKVAYSKQSITTSPIQKLVMDNSFRRFDQLIEVYETRRIKILEQYIFDKFYNQNPGLNHQGGVPVGGTLVLAYSSSTQKIVADFSLPYCCVTEVTEALPPFEKPFPGIVFNPPDLSRPFKWLDKLDLVPTSRIPRDIDNFKNTIKVNELDSKMQSALRNYVSTNEFTDDLKDKVLKNYVKTDALMDFATKTDLSDTISDTATNIFNQKYIEILGGRKDTSPKIPSDNVEKTTSELLEEVTDDSDKYSLQRLELKVEELNFYKSKEPSKLSNEEKQRVSDLEQQIPQELNNTLSKLETTPDQNLEAKAEVINRIVNKAPKDVNLAPLSEAANEKLGNAMQSNNLPVANALNKIKNGLKGRG